MRSEHEKVRNHLVDGLGAPLLVLGPSGCGKTYLARLAARELRDKSQHDFIGIYIGDRQGFRNGSSRQTPIKITEFLFGQGGAGDREWRSMSAFASWPDFLMERSRDCHLLLGPVSGWGRVIGSSRSITRLVIMDDYLVHRESLLRGGFASLMGLYRAGVQFILTSTSRELTFERMPEEREFLNEAVAIRVGLPSDDEALTIASECWQGYTRDGQGPNVDGGSELRWGEEIGKAIVHAAGNYPGLIELLVQATLQQRIRLEQGKGLGGPPFLLKRAQEEASVLEYLQALVDSLTGREGEALKLLAISEGLEHDYSSVVKKWIEHGRGRDSDLELTSLAEERLLVRFVDGSARICSPVLSRFVFNRPETKGLAKSLGLEGGFRKLRRWLSVFSPRAFVYLWLGGLVIFVAATFVGVPQSNLVRKLRLLAWAPSVFYLVWFLLRRRRAT